MLASPLKASLLSLMIAHCLGSLSNPVCDFCRPAKTCDVREMDVVVLVHSSASSSSSHHERIKDFVMKLFNSYTIGECAVNVALISYDTNVTVAFNLASKADSDDIFTAVDALPQGEDEARTGSALNYTRENILVPDNGARDGVQRLVIVITDRPSQDNFAEASGALRDDGVFTFAIGIGDVVDEDELRVIAGDDARFSIVENSAQLSGSLQQNLISRLCFDTNECILDNGGCSHICINTPGSFLCRCPAGLVLGEDQLTCVDSIRDAASPCALGNGGCCQLCIEASEGRNCSCNDGYTLSADGVTCVDTNECIDTPCSHTCINTEGSFFCECSEDYELSDDLRTCVLRPGPADCPEDFKDLGHSCMKGTNELVAFEQAQEICAQNSSRLVKIADSGIRAIVTRSFPGKTWIGLSKVSGVWQNSDGTQFTYEWAYGEPRVGNCGFVQNLIRSDECNSTFEGACEIPRISGFMVFWRIWPRGAQGKMYMPTDVNSVLITFPRSVLRFQTWYGSVAERRSAKQYIVTQNDVERQSNNGHVGFVLEFGPCRFPDYRVVVQLYVA